MVLENVLDGNQALDLNRLADEAVALAAELLEVVQEAQTVFKKVLSEPEFQQVKAGIVLQAYLPDSHVA